MSLIGSIVRLIISRRNYNLNYKPKKGHAYFDEVGNPNFTRYVKNSLRKRYIAFDVETTGLNVDKGDRIVEVAAVLFIEGQPVKSFCSLVNPKRFIPWAASRKNGISNLIIWLAPNEETVFQNLLEFIDEALDGKTIMCAHNADFDFDFLCSTLDRLGYKADIRCVDTLYLARKYIRKVDNYKLITLMDYYDFDYKPHRALDDAKGCGKILWAILNDIEISRAKRTNTTPNIPHLSFREKIMSWCKEAITTIVTIVFTFIGIIIVYFLFSNLMK